MYINKNGKRTYVGNLSTGTPVYKIELNIEEEIRNLEDEISALKCALWKKNQKLLDLKVKLALQKQNKNTKKILKGSAVKLGFYSTMLKKMMNGIKFLVKLLKSI